MKPDPARGIFIPEAVWRTLRDEGLTDAQDLNGVTEIHRAYDHFRYGLSLTEAIELVKANRNKEGM